MNIKFIPVGLIVLAAGILPFVLHHGYGVDVQGFAAIYAGLLPLQLAATFYALTRLR